VRDAVCLTEGACVDMEVFAAIQMDDKPFLAMPSDGIVGLGFSSLAVSPLASFFGRLIEGAHNSLPQFGISLGANSGELYFGGHDSSRLAAPIQWFPVDHPEDGYWQVDIQAVRVGNVTVETCANGCHAIVDSGASRLGVQSTHLSKLRAALISKPSMGGGCQGPELSFDLGGMAIILKPDDYSDEDCQPALGSLELEDPRFQGVYTFGESVLMRYYTAFDWEGKRVGFAPAASRDATIVGKPTKDVLTGTIYL